MPCRMAEPTYDLHCTTVIRKETLPFRSNERHGQSERLGMDRQLVDRLANLSGISRKLCIFVFQMTARILSGLIAQEQKISKIVRPNNRFTSSSSV